MRYFWLALIPGGLIVLAVILWRRRSEAERVTDAWLDQQERSDAIRDGQFEGVCWNWPVRNV